MNTAEQDRLDRLEKRLEAVESICRKAAAFLESAGRNPKVRAMLRAFGLELPR